MKRVNKEIFLTNTVILVLVSTIFSSLLIRKFLHSGNSSIEKAKELGIVSLTVLSGYSKSAETSFYMLAIFFLILFSVTAGIISRKNIQFGDCANFELFNYAKVKPSEIFLFITSAVFLTYYSNFFYANWLDHYVFYSEEGQHLSYISNLFYGKELFKETYVIYGPLMEYPIYWFMSILGKNIVVFRLFTYILNLSAYTIIYILLRKTCRYFITAVTGILLLISLYFPVFPAPNGSHLRTACGFIPIIFIISENKKTEMRRIFFSGIAAACALFFSPEIGISSLIAVSSVLIIGGIIKKGTPAKKTVKSFFCFFAGFFLVISLMFLYLFSRGSLGSYISGTISYSYYVTLGFGNIPFPGIIQSIISLTDNLSRESLRDFFTVFCFYWPIAVYFFSLSIIILKLFLSKEERNLSLIFGITVYGIILFRGALSRSGIDRNYLLIQPALILSIYMIEKYITIFFDKKERVKEKIFVYSWIMLFLISGIMLYCAIPGKLAVKTSLKSMYSKVFNVTLSIESPLMIKIQTKNSGHVSIPPEEAKRIMSIKNFLSPFIDNGERFFVFPNDAIFYFLFDIPMPARFGVIHDAATKELKIGIIESLKSEKPRFIISTEKIYQVDLIPEDMEFPEIIKYIEDNYYIIKEIEGVKILEDRRILNDSYIFNK